MDHPPPGRTPDTSGSWRTRSVGGVAMNDRPGHTRRPATNSRIKGRLDEHWSAWFGGLTLTREDDGTTTLRGAVTDQAELHGLLAKVRNLGATLIAVEPSTESRSDLPGSR